MFGVSLIYFYGVTGHFRYAKSHFCRGSGTLIARSRATVGGVPGLADRP
jgi:hypothetical protein